MGEEALSYNCPICLDLLCRPVKLPCCTKNICLLCCERSVSLTSSECPLCRKRIVGFLRRSNSKVNEDLWAEIQDRFPKRAYRRLAEDLGNESAEEGGDEQGCDLEVEPWSDCAQGSQKRHLCAPAPGELKEHLEQQQRRREEELARQKKEEEEQTLRFLASDPDAQALLRRQEDARRDEELARTLHMRGFAPLENTIVLDADSTNPDDASQSTEDEDRRLAAALQKKEDMRSQRLLAKNKLGFTPAKKMRLTEEQRAGPISPSAAPRIVGIENKTSKVSQGSHVDPVEVIVIDDC